MSTTVPLVVVLLILSPLGAGAAGTGRADGADSDSRTSAPQRESEPDRFCLASTGARDYATMFDSEPGGVIGADYQRATALPNGRRLWTFQDARVRLASGETTIVHNFGMIQDGNCFTILMGGTRSDPHSWLFAEDTSRYRHWYWPMDATMGSDGRIYVYLAEMVEKGRHYLERVEPLSTAVAAIDIETARIEGHGRAGNGSSELYGWSSATDENWTYLYAHCYRQFGYDLLAGDTRIHDSDCADDVTVARVPKGDLFGLHEYWTGERWSRRPAEASPILQTEGRLANPADIALVGDSWLAVVKTDDWFGSKILVEASTNPTGPFRTILRRDAIPKCEPDVCNTYFASWISDDDPGRLTIGLSHNRWDGVASDVYRPSYHVIDLAETR